MESTIFSLAKSCLCLWLAVSPAVARGAMLYVWPDSPSPSPPYSTWETAAHTIQDAVDEAADFDTVSVTNGVYATGGRAVDVLTNRVAVDRAIRLQSINGPEFTIIEGAPSSDLLADRLGNGNGAVRCVYLGQGAVLDGFTLTNGHTLRTSEYSHLRGGGAWCESSAILTNCILEANYSYQDGGGVYGGRLYRCRIINNEANSERDGDGGGADRSTLYQCLVSGNQGRKGGGVDNCTLYGCVLTGNKARVFGGGAARSTLYHCTVTRNSSRMGGGVSGDFGDLSHVYNSIVFDNEALLGANYDLLYTALQFSCTTPPAPDGMGNISIDPQLISHSHLAAGSPCRAAGSEQYAIGVDIDGEAWQTPPSMGADELVEGEATGGLQVAIVSEFTLLTVGFNAHFEASIEGPVTESIWRFGDGTVSKNRLEIDHTWSHPGEYLVQLTAYNDAHPTGQTASLSILVVEPQTYYVDLNSPDPVPPYSSWQTAATNIQDAIDADQTAGRVVMVADGLYDSGGTAVYGSMTNRVALRHGVIVRSVNGPGSTILQGAPANLQTHGNGAVRCAYVGPGSVLDGFTLTNGYTRNFGHRSREQGGGGAWCAKQGVITNCLFVGNQAFRDGGGVNGGVIQSSIFLRNHAQDQGGAADDAVLHDCLITGNSAQNSGGAISESWAYRSVIEGNSASWSSGAWYGYLNHCLLRSNLFSGTFASVAHNSHLNHCTVVGNAGSTGDILRGGLVENSIVYYHESGSIVSEAQIRFSCLPSMPPEGGGNITNAPAFADLASGNLRLSPESPCLDAAAPVPGLPERDLDGKPGSIDGDGDGKRRPDMGAYEFGVALEIERRNGQAVVSWIASPGESYVLEESPRLTPPSWSRFPNNEANPTVITWTEKERYFRLVPATEE